MLGVDWCAVLKRTMDMVVATLALLLLAPLMLLIALLIVVDSPGPVFYRAERIGRGRRPLRMLKFRKMHEGAVGLALTTSGDCRLTRVGAVLVRTRLDELPQLWHVLRGDMSFVGPRPERPEFTAGLGRQLPLYEERHLVRAGLTGWAQVNYPYGASLDDSRSKLSYDLYYVKNFGVLFDILIILQTLRVVLWPGNTVR
jgi:lipopolysaccharide/colanic/teichoic acid biosynthesis glycosyltransferase